MMRQFSFILSTAVFFLLIFCDKRLVASDNKSLFSLDSDIQYLLCSYVWNKDDQQASCIDLINFSMTCTSYHGLVDQYFFKIEESYFNDNKNIFEDYLIVQKDFSTLLMNNQLANIFIHRISLKMFINEIVNVEKKIFDLEKEDGAITTSLNVVRRYFDLSDIKEEFVSQCHREKTVKDEIAVLEKQVNDVTEYAKKEIKDLTQLILCGNEKLNDLRRSLYRVKSIKIQTEETLQHHSKLMKNCLFQEALQYNNEPKNSNNWHVCWLVYKDNFYKKKSLFEAFVIAKLLYQNSLYEKFAVSLIGEARKDNNGYKIETLLKKETITSMINSFFKQNVVPFFLQLINNGNIERAINLSSLEQCFTIMVLAHCIVTCWKSPLSCRLTVDAWEYLQKKGPLLFNHESKLFIKLSPLIVTEQNNSVIVKGDLLSSIIQSNGKIGYRDSFESFFKNFNAHISQSPIFRFIFLDHCKVDIDNVCKKKLLKDKKIIINIDNGPTVLLPHDNDYVFSANERFLHQVATNGYGNQVVCFEAPSNKIREYKDAILQYKQIFYWIYFLNKGIAESYDYLNSNTYYKDDSSIILKIFLFLYFVQACYYTVIEKQCFMIAHSIYSIIRTAFFLQKIKMPKKIEKYFTNIPSNIPWYILDIMVRDSLFLYTLYNRDIDLVTPLHKIVDFCRFEKSLFWIPLLRKMYYFSMMDNNKIIVAS